MYSEIILSTHAFVPKSELRNPLGNLKIAFTLQSKYEEDIQIETFAETETHFGYPLHYHKFDCLTNNLIDNRSEGSPIKYSMVDSFELRDNQKPIYESFCKSLKNGSSGWLLHMPTGSGKTATAITFIQKIGKTALVIVPRDYLVKQWVDRILSFTSISMEDIGIAQQDMCDFEGKKIVIGMVHSIVKDKYSEKFKRYFGTVVFDETHTLGAETFSRAIGLFPAKYKIGMTATMDRRDGLSDVYKWSIGEVFLSPRNNTTLIQPKVFLREFATKFRHPYASTMKDAKKRRGVIISALATDLARNALIAIYAKKFADSQRRVVIFSDRLEQLKLLRELLVKRHEISAASLGLFTGSTKEKDRQIILDNSQIILATYGVMAMGVDVPDLRAVIFGTPLSDVAQSVGRILRLCKGTKDPVVLDIIDTAYPDCIRWSATRQKYYEKDAKAYIYNIVN